MRNTSSTDSTREKLDGLVAAPFTALKPDQSLNLDFIAEHASHLVATGVSGAFVCGTTGEGQSLSTRERMEVAERWVKEAGAKLKIVVHVAHNSLEESHQLARHAEKIGAHAIASLGPTFFKPSSIEQLVDFCAPTAAAAPSLPFYYYHIPMMTGINLPMIDFLRVASKRIPNLAGIKFTDENMMSFLQCTNFEDGRFKILFGRDEMLLAALAFGATAAVGSTYNYMAPIYLKLAQAFRAGDMNEARRWQTLSVNIVDAMSRHGGLPAGKAMMSILGLDCGPVRPPLRNLSAEQLTTFRRELEQAGFPASIPAFDGKTGALIAGTMGK
jgi:N-acetylneuraminate lyase